MKLSKYNYIVERKNDYIIFNSVSGSVVCVDNNFLTRLKNNVLSEQESQTLFKLGFLVDDCDEFQRILENNQKNIKNQDNKIYTICPTTHCNARCFYCFESDKGHTTMTQEIADAIIKFIEEDVLQSNAKHLTINWFGGEPLLSQHVIDYISDKLTKNKKLMDKVDFSANITTNGILINDNLISKFYDWKITSVQITLDGYGKTYEKRKNYYNEPDSFKKIISIIQKLTNNKINTSIRLNYDDKNINSLLKLIKYLKNVLNQEQKQYIQTYPAKLECNKSCTTCTLSADKNYIKIIKELKKAEISKSFKQLNLKYRFAHCLVNSEYNYVIGANGDLYKCNEHVDDVNYKVGNVFDGVINQCIEDVDIDGNCKECKFFPICQGGCIQRKEDSFAKCQIEKFILDDILKLYIQ